MVEFLLYSIFLIVAVQAYLLMRLSQEMKELCVTMYDMIAILLPDPDECNCEHHESWKDEPK